jgi:hypothetical protein
MVYRDFVERESHGVGLRIVGHALAYRHNHIAVVDNFKAKWGLF